PDLPATHATRASCAIPSDPGATITRFTPGSFASFHASACSRPPLPTMRIRVGMIGGDMGATWSLRDSRRSGDAAPERSRSSFDRLRPLRSNRDQCDGHVGLALQRADIAAGIFGQVVQRTDAMDRLFPTRA